MTVPCTEHNMITSPGLRRNGHHFDILGLNATSTRTLPPPVKNAIRPSSKTPLYSATKSLLPQLSPRLDLSSAYSTPDSLLPSRKHYAFPHHKYTADAHSHSRCDPAYGKCCSVCLNRQGHFSADSSCCFPFCYRVGCEVGSQEGLSSPQPQLTQF